jgi:uncharacterized protein (DUF58 family)
MTSMPPTTGLQSGSLIDPQVLMRIRNLELRARVVVEGFWSGLHRSPYHGFSVEFTEYRPYTPGDDPRYLDWRLFARSDRYYIKRFEEETNLRCHLLVDNSRSMEYGTRGYTKAQYANTLAATLAYFLYLQGDAVGCLTFDERVRDYLPARHRPGHLRHLMLALEKPAGGATTDLTPPLRQLAEVMKKRGLVILLSDLFAPLEHLEKDLAGLNASRHEVLVFLVLDPAELDFDFSQAGVYQDVETGRDIYLDPDQARKGYLKKLNQHLSSAQRICQDLGIGFLRFTTDRPLELALFDFLRSRMQRGKKLRRSGTYPGSHRP